jgi:hypothetical protein
MLAPIYFNNDLPIEADKVDNETFGRNLPTKFETDETSVAQQSPHRQLDTGSASAHCLRKTAISLRNRSMLNSLRH